MSLRVGKVTNVYPSEGKVKVLYEDKRNTSLPLSMLTMNDEYSMPSVGDRVVTIHMDNGSSKGFVLGTYYNKSMQPKAGEGYRKDFGSGVYVTVNGGEYLLNASDIKVLADGSLFIQADNITLECSYGKVTVEELMKRLERIEDSLGLEHTI